MLQHFREEEAGLHTLRKGKIKKVATKRITKTSSQADAGVSMSKDLQVIQKVTTIIESDFVVTYSKPSAILS